jgi:hypothetical protein
MTNLYYTMISKKLQYTKYPKFGKGKYFHCYISQHSNMVQYKCTTATIELDGQLKLDSE